MKIKSRFKDYYDYVAHLYGGGDERITYVREPLPDDKLVVTVNSRVSFYGPNLNEIKTDVKFLVVNGLVYTLVATTDDKGLRGPYKLFTEKNFGSEIQGLMIKYRYGYQSEKIIKWEKYFGVEEPLATAISQSIQTPVFIVESFDYDWSVRSPTTKIIIDKNIPILQEYGINHYIQPEQLYQDIAYYVSNKMVTSPDLEVHDNMTDKEKIVQHGFDLKQSFRHRK